ncbi:EamA family transporter [Xylophilus sp. GOD-11R]|uniref:EamA family transporter n=1 Tax=Xylophilus sp. GOD-11R TaxID=3089814 RepID=UPI00298D4DF3|nr:EamA family transporter [Xylophilus sp. GOD-11R]WPB56849.1 EamA family transporter [Xylophilus sp. GOD-11R]
MNRPTAFGPTDLLAALAVVLIWGLNFVAMKYSLREFSPFQLGALRYLFAVFPLIFFVRPPQLSWRWVVPAGLAQFFQFGLLFLALRLGMSAALASVLMQTQVFFTALLGLLLLDERLTRPTVVAMLMAGLGLACFALNFVAGSTAGVTLISLMLTLGGASMWAASNIIARHAQHARPGYDPLQFVVWMSLVPILPFVLMSLVFDTGADRLHWQGVSARAWAGAVYLGWFATVAGYGLWTWLLKRHAAGRVAPFGLGVPVIGLVAGMLALGETVTAWQWAGSAFIVAALGAVQLLRPRAPVMPD